MEIREGDAFDCPWNIYPSTSIYDAGLIQRSDERDVMPDHECIYCDPVHVSWHKYDRDRCSVCEYGA